MTEDVAFNKVRRELKRASQTFGPFASRHEGFAIIKEELDELWDDIKGNKPDNYVMQEAIQVAAMTMRFLIDCTSQVNAIRERRM